MIPVGTSVALHEIPGAVIGLIVANVVIFLLQAGLSPELAAAFVYENALVPARYTAPGLVAAWELSATNYLPFITNSFMHANIWHLVINLWVLWLFGAPLEQRWGPVRLLAVYAIAGIVASLAHFAANLQSTVPALGASGAIAGILAAFALLHRNARVRVVSFAFLFPWMYEWRAIVFVVLWFAFQVGAGLLELYGDLYGVGVDAQGGIAWWAHVGGFVAGAVLVQLLGSVTSSTREIGTPRPAVLKFGEERHGTITIGGERRQRSQGANQSTTARLAKPERRAESQPTTPKPAEAATESIWKMGVLKNQSAVPITSRVKMFGRR